MSQILDKLKEAEEQRQRIIAERRRLEAEADAALAARDREEAARDAPRTDAGTRARPDRAPTPAPLAKAEEEADSALTRTPQQASRFAAALAIGTALAVVFWIGTLVPREPERHGPTPAPLPVAASAPVPAARAAVPALFVLDRDAEAFAVRAREKEGQ